MRIIMIMMWRHMLLFFKNKTSVFFSFMAVFVVLFLYICFLGDMMIEPLKDSFPHTAREISDTWIMAGTLGIVSLTTSLSVLGIVIEDKSHHIVDDFRISPLSHIQLALSYIFSTICITLIIALVTLGIAQLYIVAYGGAWMNFFVLCRIFGVMLLSIISCTSMLYYFMSFFTSATSFSNVTTIIGTLSGFLMGIYVPIGSLPSFLQTIIAWFPPSHAAALYREVMLQDVLSRSFSTHQKEALAIFKEQFGLTFTYGHHVSSTLDHILILVGMGVIFLILSAWQRKK